MKTINKEIVEKFFEYDESSPSCLRWKVDIISGKNKKQVSKGDVAGSKTTNNYWCVGFDNKLYQAHRIVAVLNNLYVEGKIIDHIDGNRLNNKIENIQVIDKSVNARNQKKYNTNTTGTCGVHFDNFKKSFVASVNFDFNKRKSKSFSVNKYGHDNAFQLACEWREKMIKELNEKGACYSERHGT